VTIRVALTGGIATGKSYVRRRIEAHGVPTIDSDLVVHQLLGAGTDVTAAVARRFGSAILRSDGAVDRVALGRLVFADAARRADLEAIVHPPVYDRIFAWAADQAAGGAAWVVADIPLLFETRHEGEFDRVIVVACWPA
jgi:dephospho-CoA kinase